jgi:Spy/CpxP family protein refolding chaperone
MNTRFSLFRHPLRWWVAAAALTLAGGVATLAHGMPFGGPMRIAMHGGGDGGPMMMIGMIEHLLDDVGATDDQRAKIKTIVKSAHDDMRQQHEAGAALHQQALAVFTAPTIDDAAAEALRGQIQIQMDQGGKRMWQALVDVSKVLTPEQRQKIAEHANKRHERMQRHMQDHGAASGAMR